MNSGERVIGTFEIFTKAFVGWAVPPALLPDPHNPHIECYFDLQLHRDGDPD